MIAKIIVDVTTDVKQKLSDLAYKERGSMKSVVVRLIEEEYKRKVK